VDNLYEYLIGAAPSENKTQKEIAAQLRRRRSFGELGALTGDRVLQPFGAGLVKQADAQASDLQDIRQKDTDNEQTKVYQDSQTSHMKEMERLTERGQTLDHIYQMLMAQAAGLKAEKAGAKPSKLTYSDRNKLEQMTGMIHSADESMGSFKDEYAQRLGPGPQSKLPNFMASIGVGTKGSEEASNWWSKWNLIYSLPQRNATFGATLTPTERQAWAESDINPSMDPKVIRDRADKVVKILRRKGAMMNRTYRSQFDPEVIDDYSLPGEEELVGSPRGHGGLAPVSAPGTAGSTAAAGPKRIRVDQNGDPIGN